MGQRKNLRCFSFLMQTKPATRSSYCRIVYIMCKTSKVTVTFFTCQSLKWWILELMQPASKCCISPGEWLGGKGANRAGTRERGSKEKGELSFLTPFPLPRVSSRLPLACDFSPCPHSHSSPQRPLCVVGRLGRGRNESAGEGRWGFFQFQLIYLPERIYLYSYSIYCKK